MLGWICFALFIATSIFMSLAITIRAKHNSVQKSRNELSRLFRDLREFVDSFCSQSVVDDGLRMAAKELDGAFAAQIDLQQTARPPKPSPGADPEDSIEKLRQFNEWLETQREACASSAKWKKEHFWYIATLARSTGFKIRSSYKDYLPKPKIAGSPEDTAAPATGKNSEPARANAGGSMIYVRN